MVRSLKEWGYWNVFRDSSDPAQLEFSADPILGLDTNVRTKGMMVAMLQQCIKDRATGRRTIVVRCEDTLEELGCYQQSRTEKGTVTFAGQSGMHDDRVISLMLGVYAAKAFGCYNYQLEARLAKEAAEMTLTQEERDVWRTFRKEQEEEAYAANDL